MADPSEKAIFGTMKLPTGNFRHAALYYGAILLLTLLAGLVNNFSRTEEEGRMDLFAGQETLPEPD